MKLLLELDQKYDYDEIEAKDKELHEQLANFRKYSDLIDTELDESDGLLETLDQ